MHIHRVQKNKGVWETYVREKNRYRSSEKSKKIECIAHCNAHRHENGGVILPRIPSREESNSFEPGFETMLRQVRGHG